MYLTPKAIPSFQYYSFYQMNAKNHPLEASNYMYVLGMGDKATCMQEQLDPRPSLQIIILSFTSA